MRSCAAPLLLSMILLMTPYASAAQTPQPFPKAAPPPAAPASSATASQPPRTTPPPPRGTTPPPPSGTAATSTSTTGPGAAAPGTEAAPTAATLGVPVPPGAVFIGSYDAGQGQRYFLFGSPGSFTEVLVFYRNNLKRNGDVIFEEPATTIFETGRFREETMAFPPSVVVKDYMWGNIGGYVNPKPGAQPARFPTVIQIVPVPPGEREK